MMFYVFVRLCEFNNVKTKQTPLLNTFMDYCIAFVAYVFEPLGVNSTEYKKRNNTKYA